MKETVVWYWPDCAYKKFKTIKAAFEFAAKKLREKNITQVDIHKR